MQNWIFPFRSRSFVLLAGVFIIITCLVTFGVTENFDQSVSRATKNVVGNPNLDLFMQIITEVSDVFYLLIFGTVMMILKRTRRIGITLMLLFVISTILSGYIKCGVDRDRPDLDYEGTPFPVEISRDTFAMFCEGGFNASYPSNHASSSIIVAIILGIGLSQRFPRGAYILFLFPILVSISRIYVLQHYPMDVIGGTVLGIMLSGVLATQTKIYKIFEESKT